MRLLSGQTKIDFMGKRKLAFAFSLLLILVAIGSLATRGLSLGIDFTGGTLVEVGYPQPQELEPIRSVLQEGGFEAAQVQYFGSSREVLIRLAPRAESQAELSSRLLGLLQQHNAGVEMRRVEFVGAQVGEELIEKGGLAMLYALIGILVYVTLRFEYRFSVGAVVALIHDVTITLGMFSVTQMEFDLTVLAALLAIIGYSLNDTIVVFDRIRENFRKIRKQSPTGVVNTSINQTLSRTLMTSLTTLLVVVALFVLGGEVIHAFAFALLVGILVGTYSSIYVASTVALLLGVSKQDLMPVKKEGAQVDDQP
ncbi:protein-export membrane protein SecF [Thiohalobacter sp. COW1]|uniref:Protein-export membrane protein SecF n=1 Tax=Thiohalobacter thiocyanaticus TaxID=585455 RepID=A0A1Z4VRU5_9GAMM|nr:MULTISPECIES: protein translocase subunit SecF [Thiohalobacter]BAZ93924.1 protein-export membrane protein SecF [Thiohalobacter thiocyanaticus]BCO31008.1 protein-export membrane protein SecF [Thiohalobacter sp. COW1]